MRERFLNDDINSFPEYAALEMLLHFSQPRKDTGDLARALMAAFGSLAAVVDAPVHELKKVEGVGEITATLIKFVPRFYMKYMLSKNHEVTILPDDEAIGEYLKPFFLGCAKEIVMVLCLDVKNKVLGCSKVSEGTVNTVSLNPRLVVECAIKFNATQIIIAHNHLSGFAVPSGNDISTTHQVYEALKNIGIKLYDHLVFADDDHVSLRSSAIIKD